MISIGILYLYKNGAKLDDDNQKVFLGGGQKNLWLHKSLTSKFIFATSALFFWRSVIFCDKRRQWRFFRLCVSLQRFLESSGSGAGGGSDSPPNLLPRRPKVSFAVFSRREWKGKTFEKRASLEWKASRWWRLKCWSHQSLRLGFESPWEVLLKSHSEIWSSLMNSL